MSEYTSTVILISICKENLFGLLSLLFPWTLKSWYISGCHHCQQLAAITHSYSKAPGWPRRASEASRSTVQAPGAAAAWGMLTPRWRAGGLEDQRPSQTMQAHSEPLLGCGWGHVHSHCIGQNKPHGQAQYPQGGAYTGFMLGKGGRNICWMILQAITGEGGDVHSTFNSQGPCCLLTVPWSFVCFGDFYHREQRQ